MSSKIEIVKELSFLYELSLSVGGTLSLEKTCEDFLQVFMRQKNIDFGAIWLKNENAIDKVQFTLIYAEPSFLVLKQEEKLTPNFLKRLGTEKAIKLSVEEAQSFDLIKEKNLKFGTYWFLEIQGIGFIKFFFNERNPSQTAFNKQEIKKAEKVLHKFSFALQSCLLHRQIIQETEQKIKYQKEIKKLALVAEKTDNAIVITDSLGIIEWTNDGFSRISGYTLNEAIGKRLGRFLQGPETDLETIKNITIQLKQEQSVKAELINYSKSGHKYWIELSIQPIYNENNELINFIAVQSEISDRKKKEEELRLAKEKAEEAGRVKQEFLSVVSHEIRTPLNGIIGMSNLLQKTQLSPLQSDYLNTIQISTENLSLIINSILDFSKIEAGNLKIQAIPFDLKKILQNLISSNELKAEQKGLGLFLKFDSKIEENLIGDGIRLSQVLLNLISNAIKFTNVGKIEIVVRLIAKMNNALVLEFIVKDTGKGIAEEMQKVIFDSFTQEDSSLGRKYGGTGLGLSISKKLITLMGGNLQLNSTEKVGTKVSFVLGFPINQSSDLEKQSQKISENLLIGKKVLVVEDNTMNQFFAQKLLEGWGMKVDIANNGKEGVEIFRKKHFDCILMDIQMPEMDGFQATKIIRTENNYIPIIALTALVVQEEIENFKSAGINDYITKPFEAELLKEKLSNFLYSNQHYSISNPKTIESKEMDFYSNQLLNQMMRGNHVQVKQMEKLFVDQAEDAINQMYVNFKSENWKEIGHLANKIKASIDMMQINNLKKTIRILGNIEKRKLEKREIETLLNEVFDTLKKVCFSIKNSYK